MKDQENLENVLIILKHFKSFFNTFSQEASNDDVLKVVDKAYKDISKLQRQTFCLMEELKYVKLQDQTQAAITKEYNKYKNKECC